MAVDHEFMCLGGRKDGRTGGSADGGQTGGRTRADGRKGGRMDGRMGAGVLARLTPAHSQSGWVAASLMPIP